MVGATGEQKLRMQIRWMKRDIYKVLDDAWWTSDRLKEIDESNVPKYFIEKYDLTGDAILEAYFLGRQAGRLAMAKEVKRVIGEKDEEQ